MLKRKSVLEQHPGCVGCQKDCNWRAATVARGSVSSAEKFNCNTVKY